LARAQAANPGQLVLGTVLLKIKLDTTGRNLIRKAQSRPAMIQRVFGQTEVFVCRMIHAGSPLAAIANQLKPRRSQMNEKPLLRIAFLWMISGFARTGGRFAQLTGQHPTKRKQK
jgi:hypothetical protein